MYLAGVLVVLPSYLLGLGAILRPLSEWLVWYSGIPIVLGIVLSACDFFWFLRKKRELHSVKYDPVQHSGLTVALTAYNDEESIAAAVRDFAEHPLVKNVIVVDNNSSDRTALFAKQAGAVVVHEEKQGYGHCVFRCLVEAVENEDADVIVLCEGDRTFRAYDIDKLLAYAPHADVVNGTRTVEALRERDTQLSTFMYYGNLFVGKLLEAKHLGRSTITDVGATYKLCRRKPLLSLLPTLDPSINLEFNAHFLDSVLTNGLVLVECPVSFHKRVGDSKGGNTDNIRALKVGLKMIWGITFRW